MPTGGPASNPASPVPTIRPEQATSSKHKDTERKDTEHEDTEQRDIRAFYLLARAPPWV